MKNSGMVRAVDKMGRVVIPKEIRSQLNVENDVDSFEIYLDGEDIILRKYQPACLFCGSLLENVCYKDRIICKSCIEKLYELRDTAY